MLFCYGVSTNTTQLCDSCVKPQILEGNAPVSVWDCHPPVWAWPENHIPSPGTYTQNQYMTACLPHSVRLKRLCRYINLTATDEKTNPENVIKQKAAKLNEREADNSNTNYSWQSLGTSSLFLFSLRCTAVCHNIASFPMKTNKCHTVTSPLAPWTPAGILCQSDKQSPDTSQALSEQKNHRKRSGTCPVSLPRNYSVPYVSGWG